MVYKGNKISKNVCSWLNVNEASIDLKELKFEVQQKLIKDRVDFKNQNMTQEIVTGFQEMDKQFENINYGISKEILDLHRKNLDQYILLEDNDIDKIKINLKKTSLQENKNISYYPKSRSGAIRFKIQNISNVLLDIHLKDSKEVVYILELEEILNLVTRIYLEKDSKLDLILINRDETKKTKLESISVIANNSSKANIIKVDFDKGNKYFNYTSNLLEDNAETNIDLAYVLSEKDSLDMSFYQKHIAKNTKGNIFIEGVLKDKSSKIFKGTLEFKEGSKGSIGNEYESVINYSKDSKAISLPILLAHEDDIKGNHAANHGEFDEEQLYYIQARGFSIEQAKNIVAEAKIIPILDKVKNRDLKNELKNTLKEKLKENYKNYK